MSSIPMLIPTGIGHLQGSASRTGIIMLIAKPSFIVSESPLQRQNFTVASHFSDPGALSPELSRRVAGKVPGRRRERMCRAPIKGTGSRAQRTLLVFSLETKGGHKAREGL